MESFYLVGIKGTGMAALAVLLDEWGMEVAGCDRQEVFSTEAQLEGHRIRRDVGFDPALLPPHTDWVVYSSAYPKDLPILTRAREAGCKVADYNEFLAILTRRQDSYVVAGSHGKTTCTAMTAFLLGQGKRSQFPFYAVYGSMLRGSERMPCQGRQAFLLEGCEYRDHFLAYHVRGALITNIEWDHPDYFPTEKDYVASFRGFADKIERGGFLVICVDDKHARELYLWAKEHRSDLNLLPYGFSERGSFGIRRIQKTLYGIGLLPTYVELPSQSEQWIDDMVGASLLATCMLLDAKEPKLYLDDGMLVTGEALPTVLLGMLRDIVRYPGTVGRMEVMADEDGVLYLDDYAHHPTQIRMVVEALRQQHPDRQVMVLFCPHTASRTRALFPGFVKSLATADKVVVQKTYASARGDSDQGGDAALLLAEALQRKIDRTLYGKLSAVAYAATDDDAVRICASWLMEGDILVTMGAGNNRFLTSRIVSQRKQNL